MRKTIERIGAGNFDQGIQLASLIMTLIIGIITFWIAIKANMIADQQTEFIAQQTEILEKQTKSLEIQTSLQEQGLKFEKERYLSDVYRDNRDIMNALFDKISYSDQVLVSIHKKIISGDKIQNFENFDRYINEFENIGSLFCDGNIRMTDLRFILNSALRNVCGNAQVFNHYQNAKAGISGMCFKLFPGSSVMEKYVNPDKCPILKK